MFTSIRLWGGTSHSNPQQVHQKEFRPLRISFALGHWLLFTLSLHLSIALSEEHPPHTLPPPQSKFVQEPASTSLEKLLTFASIVTGHTACSICGKKKTATRTLGTVSECSPSNVSESQGISKQEGAALAFCCLGFLPGEAGFSLELNKMSGAGWTWSALG